MSNDVSTEFEHVGKQKRCFELSVKQEKQRYHPNTIKIHQMETFCESVYFFYCSLEEAAMTWK